MTYPSTLQLCIVTALRCQVTTPRDYNGIITYLNSLRLPKPHKKLLLIAWQCTITYFGLNETQGSITDASDPPPLYCLLSTSLSEIDAQVFDHKIPSRLQL
ncbi:hypothetical protein Bca101_011500 [Brassica carinata]